MKPLKLILAFLLALPAGPSFAAWKNYSVTNKLTTIRDGVAMVHCRTQSHAFRMDIVSDEDGFKSEDMKNGWPFVTAKPNERYAIRLTNPLPVRVAVNLTVDGVNTITGKPSGIEDGSKWMIDPYQTITIRGWQVGEGDARRFFFTDKPKSYATWRGETLGKDLSLNCGVIGAAFFWNKEELQSYYDQHPHYIYSESSRCDRLLNGFGLGGKAKGSMSSNIPQPSVAEKSANKIEQEAGTGMGEREWHPVTQVEFHYNTGMYKVSQALLIYYDFAKPVQQNPFPGLSYAPEM